MFLEIADEPKALIPSKYGLPTGFAIEGKDGSPAKPGRILLREFNG
jgi:hypothetical protein